MPLEGWKESNMLPLNRIEILVEETQLIIRVINSWTEVDLGIAPLIFLIKNISIYIATHFSNFIL